MRNFRIATTLLMFVVTGVLFNGCKKYDEGPAFTLLTKKQRISNSWYLDKCFDKNGKDITTDLQTLMKNYNLKIERDGNYSLSYQVYSFITYSESGTWDFSNNSENIQLNRTSPISGSSEWEIIKLKNKELWVKSLDTLQYTVHLKP